MHCCCVQIKARLLADAEEHEAKQLTLEALEALLEKVRRKMQLFDAMALALRRETANIEVGPPAVLVQAQIGPLGLSSYVAVLPLSEPMARLPVGSGLH